MTKFNILMNYVEECLLMGRRIQWHIPELLIGYFGNIFMSVLLPWLRISDTKILWMELPVVLVFYELFVPENYWYVNEDLLCCGNIFEWFMDFRCPLSNQMARFYFFFLLFFEGEFFSISHLWVLYPLCVFLNFWPLVSRLVR